MKRTATTLMLLAGLGGCMSTDGSGKKSALGTGFNKVKPAAEVPGVVGPNGEPVMMTRAVSEATEKMMTQAKKSAQTKTEKMLAKGEKVVTDKAAAAKAAANKVAAKVAPVTPSTQPTGIVQASATMMQDPSVVQTAGFARIRGADCDTCAPTAHLPGMGLLHGHKHHQASEPIDPNAYGPFGSHLGTYLGKNGIMPVPPMGPPGAVAAIGAIGAGMPNGPVITGQRTAIKFVSPERAKISWLVNGSYVDTGLVAPAAYNFAQGNIYRLRLTGIPTQAGKTYYPTLEVAPSTLKTVTFLSHNSVPVSFTNDDLERVNAGNMVVKVIYLPDPAFQDAAALGGAEELVSTQLDPGADPVVEANRRGTILAIVRLGNIDLENQASPAMDAVPGMPGR